MYFVIKHLRHPADLYSTVVMLLCVYCMEASPACKTPRSDCTEKMYLSRSQQTVNWLLMITDRYKRRPISMIITGWLVLLRVVLCIYPLYHCVYHQPGLLSATILCHQNQIQSNPLRLTIPVIISTFTVPLSLKCAVSLFWEVVCYPRTLLLLQMCRSYNLLSPSVFPNGSFMWTKMFPLITDHLQ